MSHYYSRPFFLKSYVFVPPDQYQAFSKIFTTSISQRLAAFTRPWCEFFYPMPSSPVFFSKPASSFGKDRSDTGFLRQFLSRIIIPVSFATIITNINLTVSRYSSRYFPTRGPEARLLLACFAAILMPIAMFIYAWCSFKFVPWVALTIGITLYIWATFTIYLAVFNYIADW